MARASAGRYEPPPERRSDLGGIVLDVARTLEYNVDLLPGRRDEIFRLASGIRQAVFEAPDIRLSRVRGLLDRLEGIREDLNGVLATSERQAAAVDHAFAGRRADEISREHSGFVARGMASEERSALYLFRDRGLALHVSNIAADLQLLRAAERHVRETIRWAEGHRQEALALLKTGTYISAAEYSVEPG